MGLFSKIADLSEDIGTGIFGSAIKPTLRSKPVRIGLKGLSQYRRVTTPGAFKLKMILEHPEILFDNEAKDRWYREAGVEPARGANVLFRGARDREVMEAMEADLATLPMWQRIGLETATDPLTYLLGAGVVGKGLQASSAASTAAGGGRAGLFAGIRAGGAATARETLEVSGIPALGRASVRGATYPFRLSKIRAATQARQTVLAERATADLMAGRLDLLTEEQRLAMTTRRTELRNFLRTSDDPAAMNEFRQVTERLTGDALERADFLSHIRRGDVTAYVSARVPLAEELESVVRMRIEAVGGAEEAALRTPGLKNVISAVSPSELAKLEETGLLRGRIEAYGSLDLMRNQIDGVAPYLSYAQRRAGMVADPASGIIKGIKAKAGVKRAPTWEAVMKWGPRKFAMTPEQVDFWQAFHVALRRWNDGINRLIVSAGGKPIALELAKTQTGAGAMFVPRVRRFVAAPGVAASEFPARFTEQSWIARKLGLSPKGFRRVGDVKRRLGAKQPTQFQRVLSGEETAAKTVFETDAGAVFGAYTNELAEIAGWEGIAKPLLKALGKTPRQLIEADLLVAVTRATRTRNTVSKAQGAIKIIRAGNPSPRTRAQVQRLMNSEALPDEVKFTLGRLEMALDDYLAAAPEVTRQAKGLAQRTGTATKGVAESLAGGETKGTALAKSAQAAAKAEDARAATIAVKEARKQLRAVSDVVAKELEGHAAASGGTLAAAKQMRKEAEIAATKFGGVQQTGLPGLSGRYYDEKIAAEITAQFGPPSRDSIFGLAAVGQATVQAMAAGIDLGVSFLQNAVLLGSNPIGWARALYYGTARFAIGFPELVSFGAIRGDGLYFRYMEGLAKAIEPTSGRTWAEIVTESRLSVASTELYHPGEAALAMGVANKPLSRAADFVSNLPLNKAFAVQRNVGAIELMKAQVGVEQAILRRALTQEELRSVGSQVDLATGYVSTARLGISAPQATLERLLGRWGQQWFRSQTGRLVQALRTGAIEGRVARRLLAQQIAAMSALYAGAAYGLGQVPSFDPTSRDFFTLSIKGQRVGFGGIFYGLIKTVARTEEVVQEIITADNAEERKTALAKFTDIKNGRNPLVSFWRSGAPWLGGIVGDLVFDVNSNTRWDRPMDSPESFAKTLVPFSVQSIAETIAGGEATPESLAVAAGATALGLRQTPIGPIDLWREASDQAAVEAGFDDWNTTPKADQKRLLRENSDLAAADEAKDAWYAKRPDRRATAFDQIDDSRRATEDTLLALWQGVQRGNRSFSDWRQAYSDLSAKHAYLTDNLLESLGDDEPKEAATVQDRLARLYQAIQPELFDADGDGFMSELEWEAWREARRAFWRQNPDAEKHRRYIIEEFPTRHWASPVMVEADRTRRRAQDAYDQFLQLPLYRGMSLEDGQFVDAVRGLADRVSRELRFALAQQGADLSRIRIPARLAWRFALEQLQSQPLSAHQVQLIKIAMAFDLKSGLRRRFLNADRARFLMENPTLVQWYPGSIGQAGLRDQDAARLGLLGAPLGESVGERVGAL